jgi:hypothetical protein
VSKSEKEATEAYGIVWVGAASSRDFEEPTTKPTR